MIPKEEVLNKIEKGTFIWIGDNFNVRKRIAQVERLTKTQIVIDRWERYFRLGENAGW